MNLSVRELQEQDIKWIAKYWFEAAPDYLKSMGANPALLPSRVKFTEMLLKQLSLPLEAKTAMR